MATTQIGVRLTWDEAKAVYALIHDWKFYFTPGRTIMTDPHVKQLQRLYDYIEELEYTNDPGEAS